MIKSNVLLTMGIAALFTSFAPIASAGCGKALATRLSGQVPGATNHLAPTPASTEAASADDTAVPGGNIVGLWLTSVVLDGQVIFQGFESFTSDGLEFLNDNGSTLEGNVCFGTWTNAPRNMIKVYHPSWNYDMNGNLIGTVVIKSQILVSPAGNSFTGTVAVDTYDLNGNMIGPEFDALLTAKRITAN